MARQMEFFVNDGKQQLQADENTPLLYILRNYLQLKGARFGCGEGYCGACTVMVDGNAVQSCTTPMWSVDGCKVTTIEYASADSNESRQLAMLQQLFVEEQAAQCGYCIPGIIMSVASFVNQYPEADEKAVLAYLAERNLCRCGTHYRIVRAICNYLTMLKTEEERPVDVPA